MEFATKEARLKSFEPPTKRSKAGWPHKSPSADAVATAGFYYAPHKTGDDNVACYLCDRRLDGWEKDDDPIEEHLRHSPECGYAVMSALSRQLHFDPEQMDDPTSAAMEEARRATFAPGWPHESKRGWVCKTEKMIEAGWHFAPSAVSEDYASCAYCKLSLDGWEPKDNPFEEHYKRNPECPFFVFAGPTAPSKRPKAKKGRASKASRTSKASTRLSTQSNATVQSIPELDDSIDTSTTSVASNVSRASTASKPKRKAAGSGKNTRAKKAKVEAEPEPEPESIPVPAVEASEVHDASTADVDETMDNSTTSVMSTMSTATAKGKKKGGARAKTTRVKKPKATRSQKAKKAEPEPKPEVISESLVEYKAVQSQVVEAVEVEAAQVIESAPIIEAPEQGVPPTVEEESELSSIVRDGPVKPLQQSDVEYPDLQRAAKGSPLQHKSSPYPVRSSPQPMVHAHTSPLGTAHSPLKSPSIVSPAKSDIENAPPSSLPPSTRPPQPQMTPSKTRPASTWTPVDVELVFSKTPGAAAMNLFDLAQADQLSDKEKNMTVQDWIEYIAEMAENNLRQEGERVVGVFEKEGARAMGVLESIECV